MKFQPEKIEENNKKKILSDFYKAITAIEEYKEAELFFRDLLTSKETIMLARRLQIATMLIHEVSYQDIQETLKVGFTTIANVQRWLSIGGKGYLTIVERLEKAQASNIKKKKAIEDYFSPESIKERYAAYYWPQRLVDRIIDEKQKRKKRKSII